MSTEPAPESFEPIPIAAFGQAIEIPLLHERESLLDLVGLSRDRVRDEDGVDVVNDPRGNLFALIRTRHDYGDKLIRYKEFRHFMSPASIQHLNRMIVIHSETFSEESVQKVREFNLGLLHADVVEFRSLKDNLRALPEHWRVAYEDVLTLQMLNEANR